MVLFLFVIGLELKPSNLWDMRRGIFGLGLAQVLVCGVVLAAAPLAFGLSWQASLVIGLGLALSSTAQVMQTLDESGERLAPHGRAAFAILLFQDLAIVPLLLLVQLMAPGSAEPSLVESLTNAGIAIAAILLLIIVGRYLLDPMFSLLAKTRLPEIMTASALGVVIAAALIMDIAGMSYAMGAFLAGVLLAESSYRHEIEANIEPFRGLFLGLFFMAVGISLDLRVVADNWLIVLIAVPALMALKGVTIYAVARAGKLTHPTSVKTSLALAQHGEFGFVLFSSAASLAVLPLETASILIAIITFSMALSPMVERLRPLLIRSEAPDTIDEDFSDAGGSVLIIGFGRVGQIVAQPLLATGVSVTIIDNDAERVREARRFGSRVHFGDGTRRDVLRAAGAASADLIAICSNCHTQTSAMIRLIRHEFPQARLIARTYDRIHAIQVADLGLHAEVRETFESAILLGGHALAALGQPQERIDELLLDLRQRDAERLREQARIAAAAAGREDAINKIRPEPLRRAAKRPAIPE
ncbi:cation:proton antiporter [Breoghania sp. L-A4]|uniref:cation:proton antiporter domain-containing protein n=1 Tax=Breoghania sp. L-A4 TaxID=2304600 RepID=UPI0020C0FA8E|nr:cation:proton antiporter [Breoghania sp. L-A4]